MTHPVRRLGAALLLSAMVLASPSVPARAEDGPAPGAPEEPAPEPQPPEEPQQPTGPPAPAGMTWVDITTSPPRIGTPPEEILKLAGKRQDLLVQLLYETPVHSPQMAPYFIDLHETTNAQYLRFLEGSGRRTTYTTGTTALSNLEEIGSYFAYGDPEGARQAEDRWTWAQVYELNRGTLHKGMPDLLADGAGQPLAPGAAKAAFRLAALPPGLELTVFRARLPFTWFPSSGVLEGEAAPDHPVRDISYLDAQEYAEWAGKHVATEAEWEWAARGPSMRPYPWGTDWSDALDKATGRRAIEKRLNWADLGIVNKEFKPTTVPVDAMPEGRSWCGCFHMLGNVAEWTSSWFGPYPGCARSTDPKVNYWWNYEGDVVRVIRGASAADRDRVGLRGSYREFVGEARRQPPRPENHFANVGFRCALYLTPGLDRLEPAIARLLRPKKIRRDQIAVDRFAGTTAHHFAPRGATVEGHVYVQDRAWALLLAPVKRLSPDTEKKARFGSPEDVKKFAPDEDAPDPLVVGVFHTDIGLRDVEVPDPKAAPPSQGSGRRAGRGAKEVRKTVKADLPPDTYVLALESGHIGVYRSNLEFVAQLQSVQIKARKLKDGETPPAASLEADPEVDLVRCRLWIPYGGKDKDGGDGVELIWSVLTKKDALAEAAKGTDWR